MTPKLVAVTTVKALPEGKPTLVKEGKRRLACVRRKGRVDAFEDACPHEGHPLSMGLVRDGVLTCPWHNWKFELDTGHCLFGGESARKVPCEVHEGEVFVGATREGERARMVRDVRRSLFDGRVDGVVREGLRLAALDPLAPYEVMLEASLETSRFGLGEEACAVEAARALVSAEVLTAAEGLAVAASGLVKSVAGRSALDAPKGSFPVDRDELLDALLEERRDEAVLRALADTRPFEQIVADTFLPFVSLKLFDGGLALVRIVRAEGLVRAFPHREPEVRAAVARMLAWASPRSDLPTWRATRSGIAEALRGDTESSSTYAPVAVDEGALVEALLHSEKRAVSTVLERLRAGDVSTGIFAAASHAARSRLVHYDSAWSTRVGSTVTVGEPVTALAFAHSLEKIAHSGKFAGRALRPLAVQAAGLVGRLARLTTSASRAAYGVRESRSSRELLRALVFESTLAEANPSEALLVAATLLEITKGADLAPLVAPLLDEPSGMRLVRLAANAERVVRTRKPHEGVD